MRTFIGGLGIGALIGLVIAPASGADTRRAFQRRVEQLRRQFGQARSRAAIRVRRVGKVASRAVSRQRRQRPVPPARTPLSLINYGSREELMAVNGIGEVLADKIMKGRPYESESAVLEDKDLPPSVLDLIKSDISERKVS